MRILVIGLLWMGALVAAAAGLVVLYFHEYSCNSPHEGGPCEFTVGLVLPWVMAVGFSGGAIATTRLWKP